MPSTPPPGDSIASSDRRLRSPPSAATSPIAKRPKQNLESASAPQRAMTNVPHTQPAGNTSSTLAGARSVPDEEGRLTLHNTPATLNAIQGADLRSKTSPLQIKLLNEHAKAPSRGSAFAAGYDLYCSKSTVIPARGKAMVPTDISIAIPPGTYGRVAPRSGLAAKHGIATGAGVIDEDYRGPVFVLLFNHEDKDFEVHQGDRCAQLILERIVNPDVVVVDELEATVRGTGGFGSTGGYGPGRTVE